MRDGKQIEKNLFTQLPFPIGYMLVPWNINSPELLGRDCMSALGSSLGA